MTEIHPDFCRDCAEFGECFRHKDKKNEKRDAEWEDALAGFVGEEGTTLVDPPTTPDEVEEWIPKLMQTIVALDATPASIAAKPDEYARGWQSAIEAAAQVCEDGPLMTRSRRVAAIRSLRPSPAPKE